MNNTFSLSEDKKTGFILAQKEYFEPDCVTRTIGLYLHKFFIHFYPKDEFSLQIELKDKENEIIAIETLRAFMNDLIDNQIRIDLEKEFNEIKNKIVSQAFLSAGEKKEQ